LRRERSVKGFSKAFVERLGRIAVLAQGLAWTLVIRRLQRRALREWDRRESTRI